MYFEVGFALLSVSENLQFSRILLKFLDEIRENTVAAPGTDNVGKPEYVCLPNE
jgi:hypothetical protein